MWRSPLPWLVWGICLLTGLGCVPREVSPPSEAAAGAPRPALRVVLQGDPALGERLAQRWQSYSEQPLAVQLIATESLLDPQVRLGDIAIFEARWLASLVDQQRLIALPKLMTEESTSRAGAPSTGLAPPSPGLAADWPGSWKRTVDYRQRRWGICWGIPWLAVLENGLPFPAVLPPTSTPRQEQEAEANPPAAAGGDGWLVDRFLLFVAAGALRAEETSFLFRLTTARPRLTEAWLVEAAADFARSHRGDARWLEADPAEAWRRCRETPDSWAIGWPDAVGDEVSSDRADSTFEASALSVPPLKVWLDPGRGLVAAMTKDNRQTDHSLRFLSWLNGQSERQVFRRWDPRIQPVPGQSAGGPLRRDQQLYWAGQPAVLADRYLQRELHFAGAWEFRVDLEECLQQLIATPEQAAEALAACERRWNQRIDTLGSDSMKDRLAASYGLSLPSSPSASPPTVSGGSRK
jgi:hypothetical protein